MALLSTGADRPTDVHDYLASATIANKDELEGGNLLLLGGHGCGGGRCDFVGDGKLSDRWQTSGAAGQKVSGCRLHEH